MKIRIPVNSLNLVEKIPIGSALTEYGYDKDGPFITLESPEKKETSRLAALVRGTSSPEPVAKLWIREDIERDLKSLISEKLTIFSEKVTPETEFIKDLNADSLDIVELIMAVEDKFDLEIPDEDPEKIRTVQEAMDYLCSRLLQ